MRKLSFIIVAFLISVTMIFADDGPTASWVSTAGGSSSDYGYKSCTDAEGNTYVTGKFKSSTLDFGNGVSISPVGDNYDIYVAKFDSSGKAIWALAAGGSSADEGDGIAVSPDGYVYVTGAFFKTAYFGSDSVVSHYNWDVFIAKINAATGDWVWVKAAHTNNTQAKGNAVTVMANGNIAVGGYFGSSGKTDTLFYSTNQVVDNSRNGFVLIIDADGNYVNAFVAGGPAYTYLNDIASDENNNLYFCGSYNDTTAEFGTFVLPYEAEDGTNIYVAKANEDGQFAWVKSAHGPGYNNLYGIDVGPTIFDDSGSLLVVAAGYLKDTLYVGTDTTLYSTGRKDALVLGFMADDGSFNSAFTAGGSDGDENLSTIRFSTADKLILTGGYSESDFVFGEDTLTNLGKKDALVLGIDGEGGLHAGDLGGNSNDYVRSITFDPDGNFYFFGYFKSNPANFGMDVSSHGSYDIWLSKFIGGESEGAYVTFECDMTVKIQEGSFDPAASHVYVRGSFNGWGQDEMTDDFNNGIYRVSLGGFTPGETIYFKYFYDNPDTWESDPNREYTVPAENGYYYDFFDRDSVVNLNKSNIVFQVDMSVKQQEGMFNPTLSNVYVRGSFNGWGETDMHDTGGYLYESDTVSIPSGETVYFKFFFTDPDTWESDPNREYTVPDYDAVAGPYWFDRDSIVTVTGNGNILFQVDMSVMSEIGIFNPNTDSMQVRGGFNGWSDSDPARSKMSQNPLVPTVYTLNVPFENQPIGDQIDYKFYANLADPGIWTDGWERPATTGGGNRQVMFEGVPDQTLDVAYYDDVTPGLVIPSGQSVSITFSVDMTPAMDSTLQAVPFDPAADTLYWISEQPSFVRSQGWVDTDDMRVLQLTDPDGDHVYTATLTVNGPSFNEFVYRYGYVHAADGSFIHEPAGYGVFAYRVRYIAMNGPRDFVQPYAAPTDVWTNQENKSDQWEPNPLLSDVKQTGEVVKHFELNQNYPNPFNPTTKIRFAIPSKERVTLKVFNVLGEEIVTLINNRELNAGSYDVNFNAINLPSGVYIYKLTAGKYSATKKMMLLK